MRRLRRTTPQCGRLRHRVGLAMDVLTAGLRDPALWQRAAVLACLRERSPDLLAGGPASATALADLILCSPRDPLSAAPDPDGRTP